MHPITGEAEPDETDRVLVLRPVGPKLAGWPEAAFIVGNQPFNFGKHVFAIPDHPWADGSGTAAIRIAFAGAEAGQAREGR